MIRVLRSELKSQNRSTGQQGQDLGASHVEPRHVEEHVMHSMALPLMLGRPFVGHLLL